MPLNHSIEARRDYDSTRHSAYPPPDLQIPSFRAVARKAVHRTRHSIRSLRTEKKEATSTNPHDQQRTSRPPIPRSASPEHKTATQSQSPLFALPIEIRLEIYNQVLGYSNVHIKNGTPLRHHRCKCASCPGLAFFYEYGTAWKRTWECDGSKYDYDGDRLPVALLRTCRRVHAEAAALLYSSNTFSFKGLGALRRFLEAYPWAGVAEVHLDLLLEEMDEGSTWDMLVSLPSLRTLEIRLHPHPSSALANMRGWGEMGPLERFRGKEGVMVVRVYVPCERAGEEWLLGRPFEIRSLDDWGWNGTRTSAMKIPVRVF